MSSPCLGILRVEVAGVGYDELPLYQPLLRLGRSEQNDVVLDDPNVSGRHAQLSRRAEGWLVEDLGSRNGSRVNGRPIPPGQAVPIQAGDLVQIDQFSLQVRSLRPEERQPPAVALPARLSPKPSPTLRVYFQGRMQSFPLDKDTVTIGRKPDNDVCIPDSMVSGHHARLERQGTTYRIVDLGSTNGLVHKGQRVTDHTLADHDRLHIGREIVIQYRAFPGFVAGPAKKGVEAPKTQYLDMRAMPAGGQRITIGRHSSNTLRLNHPRVSRYHAVIEKFGTRFRLRDLNSDNGTFVNGKQVKEAWIKEGDEIRVASFRLVFREDGITHFDEAGNIRLDALQVEKWYNKNTHILQKVTLSIYPKEFVAIVGASGAGKTTLMNALNGFDPANGPKSRVLVNGQNLYTHMDEYRSEMGFVPQEDIIHRELTVYQALDYAAQLRMPADTSPEERRRRIEEVLKELGLEQRRNNTLNALSGGQRKRVSIGVELLTKPGLFFLDEATSGLDPGTETEMMQLLRELADGGRTVILVTHATKNVMMCDQVVFLARGGYLAYYGPPNEALDYFDQWRTPEERRFKEQLEFDDIYKLIETRGKPEEWAERFRPSRQYREYVVDRVQSLKEQVRTPTPVPMARRRRRPVSSFRQFLVLSARNLRIMTQDKVGLALMLAVAPFIGLMDFIWGKKLFDPAEGDATRVVMMMFMMGLIALLAGALSSVREIVKEVDVYKRERTVVLKVLPYILSKVWVGVILALYQAAVFALTKKLFVDPQLTGPGGFLAMYVTVFLCAMSGYIIGLAISAAAPNQNIALFLVLGILVPQFLFAGALIPLDQFPGGKQISVIASTRWAFEALVRISGIGNDVADDPCYQLPPDERNSLTQAQKDELGCRCAGTALFTQCRFPGVLNPKFYNEEVASVLRVTEPPKPIRPTRIPSPSPLPKPKTPPPPGLLGDQQAYQRKVEATMAAYQARVQQQMADYQATVEAQGAAYEKEMEAYQKVMENQGGEREKREKAVANAEGLIRATYDLIGRAFGGSVESRWLAMGVIAAVFFLLALFFQKRKDVI